MLFANVKLNSLLSEMCCLCEFYQSKRMVQKECTPTMNTFCQKNWFKKSKYSHHKSVLTKLLSVFSSMRKCQRNRFWRKPNHITEGKQQNFMQRTPAICLLQRCCILHFKLFFVGIDFTVNFEYCEFLTFLEPWNRMNTLMQRRSLKLKKQLMQLKA